MPRVGGSVVSAPAPAAGDTKEVSSPKRRRTAAGKDNLKTKSLQVNEQEGVDTPAASPVSKRKKAKKDKEPKEPLKEPPKELPEPKEEPPEEPVTEDPAADPFAGLEAQLEGLVDTAEELPAPKIEVSQDRQTEALKDAVAEGAWFSAETFEDLLPERYRESLGSPHQDLIELVMSSHTWWRPGLRSLVKNLADLNQTIGRLVSSGSKQKEMEYMLPDLHLQQSQSGGFCHRLVCFLCLLASALASAVTLWTRDKERAVCTKLSLESTVSSVCFLICAASSTLLTSEQAKTWLSLASCGSSFLVLLVPAAKAMKTRSGKAQNELSVRSASLAREMDFNLSDDVGAVQPILRTKRASKPSKLRHFESTLQVIHENSTFAVKSIGSKDVSQVSPEKIVLIIPAVYSLASQRKKWAKRPDETWGKFLTKLDTILAGQAKPNPPSLMPSEAWYEISRWCARHSPQELQSIVETAIKLHRAPGEDVVWELGRMLDATLDVAHAEGDKLVIPVKLVTKSELPKKMDALDAEKLAELLMRMQAAVEKPLYSFSDHLKPALARRIHVGTMDYMGGSHESYRRTFEFIEMTNTWHDVDKPTRDIGDLYRKKLNCSYKDPAMYKALAARAADKRDSFRMVVKVSCVATHLTKLQNVLDWWPALWQ
ncbi:unnamed protein product, partial [Symbiodinium sp. KB8]